MAKFKQVNSNGNLYGYLFNCPGCNEPHVIPTTGSCAWQFNGDVDRPTLSPSILQYESKWPDGTIGFQRCHSFVREGHIEYQTDCGHALAGQTVELPDITD